MTASTYIIPDSSFAYIVQYLTWHYITSGEDTVSQNKLLKGHDCFLP
jgi:hypothetical protein